MNDVVNFYNNFENKLINDYISGNERIESAMLELFQFVNPYAENILDIGCGIGWSTHEMACMFKNTNIHGIDLSPKLIECAKRLFRSKNLKFSCSDINDFNVDKKYDVITMIDVYEHIHPNGRNIFHAQLNKILNEYGRLLIATPSKFHQEFLKEKHPEGLQPVDETIELNDIQKLADDIKGDIIYIEYQSIWNDYDYVYFVIQRKPRFEKLNGIRFYNKVSLEPFQSRINRVRRGPELLYMVNSYTGQKVLIHRYFLKLMRVLKLR